MFTAIAIVSLQKGVFSQVKDTLNVIVKQDTANYNFKIIPQTNYFVVINSKNNKEDSLLTFADATDVKLLVSNLTKLDMTKKTSDQINLEVDRISTKLIRKYNNEKDLRQEKQFFEGDIGDDVFLIKLKNAVTVITCISNLDSLNYPRRKRTGY